jgi:hypothetical protein
MERDSQELEGKLKQLKKDCETRAMEIAYAQVRKVLAEREHAEVLIEGRSNQFTVDMETKL